MRRRARVVPGKHPEIFIHVNRKTDGRSRDEDPVLARVYCRGNERLVELMHTTDIDENKFTALCREIRSARLVIRDLECALCGRVHLSRSA